MSTITHLQTTVGALDGKDANGVSLAVRSSRQGGQLNSPISASFQEAVLRGNCYSVAAAAGVTTQAGLSVTTPSLTLANPAGSGVNAILWYAGVTYTVVFAAVAAIWLAAGTTTGAAVTGTDAVLRRNCLLGSSNNPKINPFLAATLPVVPVAVDILGAGLTGAVNLFPQMLIMEKWYNGAFVITPGSNVSIQTSTVSGTSGQWATFKWEEVPV